MFRVTEKIYGVVFAGLLLVGSGTLVGCADNGAAKIGSTTTTTTGNGLASGGASTIYTIQEPASGANSYLLQYPISSSTNLTPTGALTLPSTFYATAVATDTNGLIYVGGVNESTSQGEVLVFSAGATGTPNPVSAIVGAVYTNLGNTTFAVPQTMTVTNGVLYIGSYDLNNDVYLTSFPTNASGAATPTTHITGTSTLLNDPLGIVVDTGGNVYVSQDNAVDTGDILVFAPGATGNVAPIRDITTSNIPYGLAIDASNNLYTVLDNYTGAVAGSLVEFAAGANGAATPTNTITGTSTDVYFGLGLRRDSVGNLYVLNEIPGYYANTFSVLAFSPTATGNAAPAVNLNSASLSSPSSELAIR